MTQKIIDIGKGSVQYLLTLVFAAIGVYVGMRITLAEIKTEQRFLKEEMTEIKKDVTTLWNTTLSLQIDNAIVCRQLGIERTRSDKSPGKE
jgi:hypothetical protein